MDQDSVFKELLRLNEKREKDILRIYANAYLTYHEASKNIRENGAIVYHPRTGAPVENPYLKVQSQASAVIRKIRLKTGSLWDSASDLG